VTAVAPPSLLAYFDASLLYGDDNATPTSAAVGVLVEDGTETYCRSCRAPRLARAGHESDGE